MKLITLEQQNVLYIFPLISSPHLVILVRKSCFEFFPATDMILHIAALTA